MALAAILFEEIELILHEERGDLENDRANSSSRVLVLNDNHALNTHPEGNTHIISPHLTFGQIPEGIASLAPRKN